MNELPVSLLNEIFLYLHQEDKVECMLVCCHWVNVIETHSLFHTVRISSITSLKKWIQKITELPSRGAKVKRLVLNIEDAEELDINDLNNILLSLINLQSFFTVHFHFLAEVTEKVDYPFLSRIKYLADHSEYSIAKPILKAGPCVNLTALTFGLSDNVDFTFLKNAPNLKNLLLYHGHMKLDDLETIHDNTPSLISLQIEGMSIANTIIHRSIKPATLITKFSFLRLFEHRAERHRDLLEYIHKKYPNLTHFEYNIRENFSSRLNEFYEPLLESLKQQLKSLSLSNYDQVRDQYSFLGDGGWRITQLKLRLMRASNMLHKKRIANNSIRYIQSLNLENVIYDRFEGLKGFVSLQRLKMTFTQSMMTDQYGRIIYKNRTIKFQSILNCCPPSLKSLSLKCIDIKPELHASGSFYLESLSLEAVGLPPKFDTFISQHFPRLSTLKLKDLELDGQFFILPSINLKYLYFEKSEHAYDISVRVLTFSDNQTRRYILKEGQRDYSKYPSGVSALDSALYPPVKSVPEINADKNMPCFTLVCNLVRYIVLKPIFTKQP